VPSCRAAIIPYQKIPRKLRIALVITELDPGGAEKCLVELARFLHARGHVLLVLALGPPPQAPYRGMLDALEAVQIDVRFYGARRIWTCLPALAWLRRQLDAFSPDVVQSMLWHANVATSLASRGRSWPVIGGVRVSDPRVWRHRLERWTNRRVARYVCVSQTVADHCRWRVGLPEKKLVVIPNGIAPRATPDNTTPNNIADAQPGAAWSRLGVPGAQRVMLFVGRLDAQKGVLDLVRHADQWLAGLPEWTLVLMGRGVLAEATADLVARAEHAPRLRLVDWQPDPRRWMAAAELVLLPAVYEGMPNVLLEAMAEARPFVAFDVDGVQQLLQGMAPPHLAQAQIAARGDWAAFRQRVEQLAQSAALRAAAGTANARHVYDHFRLEQVLTEYETLFRQLVPAPADL
jgi:glycosyltransferase involved in cell wall biosynthesis